MFNARQVVGADGTAAITSADCFTGVLDCAQPFV
jgi:hypothetical protein